MSPEITINETKVAVIKADNGGRKSAQQGEKQCTSCVMAVMFVHVYNVFSRKCC